MSTLQHTLQPAFRNRLALVIVLAGAFAALTVALIVSSSNSASIGSPAQLSPAALERQLESVSGARFGVPRPTPSPAAAQASPERQLQAVAGARYHQPIGVQSSR